MFVSMLCVLTGLVILIKYGLRIVLLNLENIETDLLPGLNASEENEEPFYNVIKHSPRVPMETVVEGVLTLLIDKTRNSKCITCINILPKSNFDIAETLLATPKGIITMEIPQQPGTANYLLFHLV